jgi:hypothetical protein
MPLRVHMLALAMCGTMTALGSDARPGAMAGSCSNTSRPFGGGGGGVGVGRPKGS